MSRPQEDIKREERVYRFLLKLSNITINPNKPEERPKVRDITSKWGFTGNRTGQKFIERVLSNLYSNPKENKEAWPSLSLNRLVKILHGIETYWKTSETTDSVPKILKKLDKIRAIRKYCELSREEKQYLGFSVDFKTYIQENFINLSDNYMGSSNQVFDNLPDGKYVVQEENDKDKDCVVTTIRGEYLDKLIKEVIKDKLSEEWLKNNLKIVNEIQDRVKKELTVIAVQSGLEIARYHLPKTLPKGCTQQFEKAYQKQWESQLPDEWIKQLTANIIENRKISDKIPITFRYLEIQKIGPLPFESEGDDTLINQDLLQHDPDKIATGEAFKIFRKNNAYKVRIHFRLTLEEKELDSKDKKIKTKKKKIDFFEEVSGISSILSLIRKALNRGLLWDIPCLKDYFPVMQEVYIEDKLFGGDSSATVWSKSRGRLIELDDLKKLLKKTEDNNGNACPLPFDIDSYIEGSDIIQSDYLGFDLIESIAIAGFHAHLKLIEQTGIAPNIYLRDLESRIKEKESLLKGKRYLRSYPFSLLAMEKHLEKTILNNYRNQPNTQWSKIAYEAKLFIIQGYLDEGLVKKAGRLLEEVEIIDKDLSHFIKASYYLCQAEYSFLCDENEVGKPKREIINDCQKYLEKAEDELRQRLLEFFRVGEMAQGNLSPLYYYWTKIYTMKARLSLFFPKFLKGESVTELFPSLVSFGKARVYYAPREGDSYLCAKVSLYQSWCYLIQAYIGGEPKGFDKETCIRWAKKLIDHALLNYQEASQECYRDYTDNFFSDDQNQNKYEPLIIQRPPFLNLIPSPGAIKDETDEKSNSGEQSSNSRVKVHNISSELIKRDFVPESREEESTKGPIDLFGQHSSLYFFVLGMLELCDNYSEENALNHLQEAYNYFVCSWAIAEGCSKLKKDGDVFELNRKFDVLKIESIPIIDKFNVSKLRGLFFHRISEWADLAKIFLAVCQSIIAEKEEKDGNPDFSVVNAILNQARDVFSEVPQDFAKAEFVDDQTHYNRHLESAFKRIKAYLKDYMKDFSKKHREKSLLQRRDKMVKDIFFRLRGD